MGRHEKTQKKRSMSFRFQPSTIDHLKQRSRQARSAQTELVERYISEGLRQDEHPAIYFREAAAGRRPALIGTRLDVAEAITTIRQNNSSLEETAEYLEIPVEQLEAAARYYADYKEEVDELIQRSRLLADRERERWRRQQEALA